MPKDAINKPWDGHRHIPVPQYQKDGAYRTDVTWPCKLCDAPLDPWSSEVNRWLLELAMLYEVERE